MMQTTADESPQSVGYDQVREILRKRCVTCHNPDEMRGDLDLKNMQAIQAGSSSGPVVVAGKSNLSLLYTSAAHLADPKMPPNSPKIPARELDLLRRWIDGGLVEKLEDKSAPSTTVEDEHIAETSSSANFVPVRKGLRPTAIVAMDAHPLNDLVAIAGNGQTVLMKASTGKIVGAIDFPEGDVTAIRFSKDGTTLVVGGGVPALTGKVIGFDVASGRKLFELADETDSILALDISPDGSRVAVGGPSKVVRIYRVSDGKVIHTLRKHTDWLLSVRFSPDGLLLASGDRFGGLFVWNPETGEEFHALKGHTGPVSSVAWDVDSETLISAGDDGIIRTWNMHHSELTSHWNAGAGAVLSMARSSEVTYCGGRDRKLVAWQSPEIQIAVAEFADQIDQIVTLPASECVVASDASGAIQVLDANTLQVKHKIRLPTSPELMDAVLVRLDSAEQEFAARESERMESEQLAASVANMQSQAGIDLATAVERGASAEPLDQQLFVQQLFSQQLELATQQVQQLESAVAQSTHSASTLTDALATLEAAKSLAESQLESQTQQLNQARRLVQSLRSFSSNHRSALLEAQSQQEQLLQAATALRSQLKGSPGVAVASSRADSLLAELVTEFEQSLAVTKATLMKDVSLSQTQSNTNAQ